MGSWDKWGRKLYDWIHGGKKGGSINLDGKDYSWEKYGYIFYHWIIYWQHHGGSKFSWIKLGSWKEYAGNWKVHHHGGHHYHWLIIGGKKLSWDKYGRKVYDWIHGGKKGGSINLDGKDYSWEKYGYMFYHWIMYWKHHGGSKFSWIKLGSWKDYAGNWKGHYESKWETIPVKSSWEVVKGPMKTTSSSWTVVKGPMKTTSSSWTVQKIPMKSTSWEVHTIQGEEE